VTLSQIILKKFGSEINFEEISTDTRTIKPNSIFLALKGNNFDGNLFVEDAYKKGAKAAIINSEYVKRYSYLPITLIGVKDTLETYQEIAKEYIKSKKITKIGITGTSGKTTTKELLKAILSTKYNVFANEGNLNNQIGVPFSILNIKDEDIAVIEMGTGKPSDIERLTWIFEPDIGIVTSIGEAHIEYFGSIENIAKEKSDITKYGAKGITIKKIEYEYFKNYKKIGLEVFKDIIEKNDQTYDIKIDKKYFNFKFWGEYNLYNLAIAVYVSKMFGIDEDLIIKGVENVTIPPLRWQKIEKNDIEYILDCYNANPLSIKEALKSFDKIKTNKNKVVILGDMLELGDLSSLLHAELGHFINSLNIDSFIFFGKYIENTFKICNKEKYYFNDKTKLKKFISSYIDKNKIVLLKGSRGMRLEEIIS